MLYFFSLSFDHLPLLRVLSMSDQSDGEFDDERPLRPPLRSPHRGPTIIDNKSKVGNLKGEDGADDMKFISQDKITDDNIIDKMTIEELRDLVFLSGEVGDCMVLSSQSSHCSQKCGFSWIRA